MAIAALKLVRFARPSGPIHLHQRVALWFVAQGRKELVLAYETFAYGQFGGHPVQGEAGPDGAHQDEIHENGTIDVVSGGVQTEGARTR